MNAKENIRIAIYSIRTNLLRSLLTMLGIIIGVFSVIAIITVGDGGRDYIVGMIRDMGQSMVMINVDRRKADGQFITRKDVELIRNIEHVQYVTPRDISMGTVSTAHFSGMGFATSGNPDILHVSAVTVTKGRFFNWDDYNAASRVCVIAKMNAQTLFGTQDVIGSYIDFKPFGSDETVRLRVIGLAEQEMGGADADQMMDMMEGMTGGMMGGIGEIIVVILPSTVTDQLSGNDNGRYDNLNIMADDEQYLDVVGNAARNLLYIQHGNAGSGAYTVANMATYIDLLDSVIKIFTTFIAGVSAISLLVGGIGVMNIMLVSVTERTREIGIRKALGAKTGNILFQFLTESVILCLIGGTIGFILGVATAGFVAWYMGVPIALKLSTVAIGVGFSSAIGIFFGIYPARRAALMLPIDALRRE